MTFTVVFIRHAKSDWSGNEPDIRRPLAARGRNQAPAVGPFLQAHGVVPDRALVSPAKRTRQTWKLIAPTLPSETDRIIVDDLYTEHAAEVLKVIATQSKDGEILAVVGHNPSLEEAVFTATQQQVTMPTSSVAIVTCATPEHLSTGMATLVQCCRPADGRPGLGAS